tara:strand:- start:583 stop:840 length:258 start_codon:yes stop_codon:yes gene_type:complete
MLIINKGESKMTKIITYIATDNNAPDFPRAWGQGETHLIAKLRCEIAIREKVLGKIERSGGRTPIDLVEDYVIKEDKTFAERYNQ